MGLLELLASEHAATAVDAAGRTALHTAAAGGHTAALELLLTAPGAPLSARDHAGATPLTVAAAARSTPCLVALLAAGADANPQV